MERIVVVIVGLVVEEMVIINEFMFIFLLRKCCG